MIGVIGERSEGRGIMVEASAMVRQLIATCFPWSNSKVDGDVISLSKTVDIPGWKRGWRFTYKTWIEYAHARSKRAPSFRFVGMHLSK